MRAPWSWTGSRGIAQSVSVAWAQNRVLAQAVRAVADTPPFPSSAMDGYALAAGPAGRRLTVVGESRAGTPSERVPGPQEAIRVSTGAAVPEGAEAVIPQENVTVDGDAVTTTAEVAAGEHIRRPGEDMRAGVEVLAAGTRWTGSRSGPRSRPAGARSPSPPGPTSPSCAPAMSCVPPASPSAPARSTTPTR